MRYGKGWRRRFRGHGLRITEPRKAILKILTHTDEHLSAKEIFHKLHSILPGAGIATVYRNLEVLERFELVSKFDFGDGVVRYSLKREDEIHFHLICKECGVFIDYDDRVDEIRRIFENDKELISDKYGFEKFF
jgi:Fur family ferric uptake transcriptional regulator